MQTDIIIPIWNRPVETRRCLVSLMHTAPEARLILVDNASDRETEILLEEFSDILGERALLVRNERNLGTVEGIIRGLAHAAAPFVVVVQPTSHVCDDWLRHLIEAAQRNPSAGIVVPPLVPEVPRRRTAASLAAVETTADSFGTLLLRLEVIRAVGFPNPSLDNGKLCLADFCRRALRHGFLTIRIDGDPVVVHPEQPLGSTQRREKVFAESRKFCLEAWGDDREFVVYFPKETAIEAFLERYAVLLDAARRGDRFIVLLPSSLQRLLPTDAISLHDRIEQTAYRSVLMSGNAAGKAARRALSRLDAVAVSGLDDVPFPGGIEAEKFIVIEQRLAEKLQRECEVHG